MISLERRLQISLGAMLTIILLILLLITGISTRHLLQKFVISRLSHDGMNIFQALNLDTGFLDTHKIDPIYNSPFSGHYFLIHLNQEHTILSKSLAGRQFPAVAAQSKVQRDIPGPENQRLFIWTDSYQKNGNAVVLSIAEDMSLYKEQLKRFLGLFIFIGMSGILLTLLLQRYIIRRLFQYLDKSQVEMRQIETGKRQELSEDVPSEIYPLVTEFNHTLVLMQQRLERSRNALGNLAHALKTPLSILLQNLEAKPDLKQARQQTRRIQQLMERELKRARFAGLGNSVIRFDPRVELPVLIKVLKQAHHKEQLHIEYEIGQEITVFGDREDMLELLGNILDNACKWARSKVICRVEKASGSVLITIEDDGLSQTKEELSRLTTRGTRFDETVSGHGLGLAICQDIVKLYGGRMTLGQSTQLGGFQVTIELPL